MAKKYDIDDSGGVDPLRPVSDSNPVRDAAETERLERERRRGMLPGVHHSDLARRPGDPVAIHPVGAGDLGGFISHLADAAAALRSGDLSLALTHLFYLFDQARLALTTGPAVYEAAGGEAAIPGKPGSLDGSVLASMADQLDGCAEQCKARVKAAKDAGTVPGRALRTVPWEGVMPVTLSVFHRLFAARQAAPPVPLPGP